MNRTVHTLKWHTYMQAREYVKLKKSVRICGPRVHPKLVVVYIVLYVHMYVPTPQRTSSMYIRIPTYDTGDVITQ